MTNKILISTGLLPGLEIVISEKIPSGKPLFNWLKSWISDKSL